MTTAWELLKARCHCTVLEATGSGSFTARGGDVPEETD